MSLRESMATMEGPMKLRTMLPLFFLIVLEIALAPERGLGQASSDKQMVPPSFSLKISAPPVVKVGQRFVLEVSVTNLSDHVLDTPSAWFGNFDAVYNIEVRDGTGTQLTVHAPAGAGYLVGASGILDPGKTKVENEPIQDVYDLNKPGTYEIRVKRCIDLKNPEGNEAPKYDESKGVVWSNKITVTVVPAT
jgi:hypothetical protein